MPIMSLPSYDCFIDGQWRPAHSRETLEILDPADGAVLAHIARGGASDIDEAVRAAQAALPGWADCVPVQRGRVLHAIARRILEEQDRLARLESQDTGKPLAQAQADAVAAARFFEYYAGVADKVLGSSIPLGPDYADFTVREPLGVTAQIVPWNYPLQIASRGLAPALATGNTVVLKPAELACLSVLELTRICHEEGLPPGVLNVVPGLGQEAGYALAAHPGVNLVVFTGSVATGAQVMRTAADNIVPVLLELGGKSPNIVFDDADLDQAVKGAISGVFGASGQTCMAGSRLLVQKSIHDAFVAKLVAAAGEARIGDPSKMETQIGPIATRAQWEKILRMIEMAKAEGAVCALGGHALSGPEYGQGQFVAPTIFTGVRNDMRIAQEEVFGPVLCVIPFEDEEDALRIANDVEFGLAAGVWTRDLHRAMHCVDRLRAGTVWVNNYRSTSFTTPFGGYKRSGLGREGGVEAIKEYLQTKSVWITTKPNRANPFVLG